MYTLHAAPGSSSFAPHIILEEIGEPYRLVLMSAGHKETRSPDFRKLNPKGRIPVLSRSGFTLTETPAILCHLALTSASHDLLRATPDDLVRTVEWTNWLSSAVHEIAIKLIWRTEIFSDDRAIQSQLAKRGMELLLQAFDRIEKALRGRAFALGKRYSVSDAYLLVFFRWGNRLEIDMQTRYPGWTAHARQLEERPAVQRALAQENISLWC